MRHTFRLASRIMAVPLLIGVVALAAPAFADKHTGQGIIEVDGREFDTDPGNEPHVGCVFQVDFKNYDEGDTYADVRFELQPPTDEPDNTMRVKGDVEPFIGEDGAGGQDDIDAQERYVLSFSGPPAKQGYHVKLTINAEGTTRADKRYKVYYVRCPRRFNVEPSPSPSPNPGPSQVIPTAIKGGTTSASPAVGAAAVPDDGTSFGLWAMLLVALTVAATYGAAVAGSRRHTRHGS